MGKPERKRHLGRPRRRWEYNIKTDLREVGCDPGDWIDLADDIPMANLCKGSNEPPGSLKANTLYSEIRLLNRYRIRTRKQ